MATEEVKKDIIKKVFPKKDPWLYKGTYGKLLIVSGNYIMTGSPILAGIAAYRTGTDVVYLAGPERAMNAAASYFPVFINLPLKGDILEDAHVEDIFNFAADMHTSGLVIGPGLGREKKTLRSIIKIIDGSDVPIVADADAIHALGEETKLRMLLRDKNIIITPHAEEFKALTGETAPKELRVRIDMVEDVAEKIGATIILKGRFDIISDGDKTAINKTGNVFMTKGGLGDTLAGICGSLMCRKANKMDSFTAACAAAYINGAAGDLAMVHRGESLITTEVLDAITTVIARG